ncbi:MAG TPA: histidine phosphatase family protein [Acidocella sp.]|nr:histidine phosphatase family protein [Acidocella sp.]
MPTTPSQLGLLRHGATSWTLAGRYQGQANPPLCAEGIAQAAALGLGLRAEPVCMVVSSPLLRARQTATILAEALALPAPRIDANLTEMSFGAWEGLTQAEVKEKWPEILRAWKRTPYAARLPGGEMLAQVRARVRAGLRDWQSQPGRVLLVTHAVWIRLACIEQGEATAEAFRNIEVAPASVRWVTPASEQIPGTATSCNKEEVPCGSP